MELEIDGVTTYYEIHGEGIPIVTLHGWGTDHRIFKGCLEPVFAGRKDGFKRIYFDIPGMGRSRINSRIRSSDDIRDFIRALIAKLIPGEKYALVGKSYGGYLSRGIAKADSANVLGLFLLCPVVTMNDDEKTVPPHQVCERDAGLETIIPKADIGDFELFHAIQTQAVWERYREWILPGAKLANQEFLSGVLGKNKYFTEAIDTEGERYSYPTLILAGKQDWCVGYADQWKLAAHYPQATYVALEKAGHNLEYEKPEIFNAHASAWLDEVVYTMRGLMLE